MSEVNIVRVEPADLHSVWDFVGRGVDAIIKKIEPDFIREDVYTSIKVGGSTLWIATQGDRRLGWFNGYFQRTPFSNRLEFFLWCVWDLPLKERKAEDDFRNGIEQVKQFWREHARANGCFRVVTLSPRDYSI